MIASVVLALMSGINAMDSPWQGSIKAWGSTWGSASSSAAGSAGDGGDDPNWGNWKMPRNFYYFEMLLGLTTKI